MKRMTAMMTSEVPRALLIVVVLSLFAFAFIYTLFTRRKDRLLPYSRAVSWLFNKLLGLLENRQMKKITVHIEKGSFDFNILNWKVGELKDCSVLSEVMQSIGGFPKELYLRKEMLMIWRVLCEQNNEGNLSKWVITGSSGIGKSLLLVLHCFYLALEQGYPILLVRQLMGDEIKQAVTFLSIFIHPDGLLEIYSRLTIDKLLDIDERMASDGSSKGFKYRKIVLDGWSQDELRTVPMFYLSGSFDLLATSAQYIPKQQDTRRVVLLPAWYEDDLRRLTSNVYSIDEFKARYFVCGGSPRVLLRGTIEDAKNYAELLLGRNRLLPEIREALMSSTGGKRGEGIDRLRRIYVTDTNNIKSYTDPRAWVYHIDSIYALNELVSTAYLQTYIDALQFSRGIGQSAYGSTFEAMIHKIMSIPGGKAIINAREYSKQSAKSSKQTFKDIHLPDDIAVEYLGSTEKECDEYIEQSMFKNKEQNIYWHPKLHHFLVVDIILNLATIKLVIYLQITVAEEHSLNCESLNDIHQKVKKALGRKAAQYKFQYIAITPTLKDAETLRIKKENTDLKEQISSIGIYVGCLQYDLQELKQRDRNALLKNYEDERDKSALLRSCPLFRD